jgi:hypothetical protein
MDYLIAAAAIVILQSYRYHETYFCIRIEAIKHNIVLNNVLKSKFFKSL